MLVTWGSKGYYQNPYNKWSDSKEPLNSEKKNLTLFFEMTDYLFLTSTY